MRSITMLLVAYLAGSPLVGFAADDPVFSGPQPGEKLPPLRVKVIAGDDAGKIVDVVGEAEGKPQIIFFLHARTRPAFGLMNTVMRFAASRRKDGLEPVYVFLSDDPTETETWLGRLRSQYFATGVRRTLSMDGIEGPGSYGLNRNVTVTAIVADKGRVTANFALIQPSEQSDGPKIFAALVDVLGGGPVPAISEYSRSAMNRKNMLDPRLTPLVRKLNNPELTGEAAEQVVQEIKDHLAKYPGSRGGLAAASRRVKSSPAFSRLDPGVQKAVNAWAAFSDQRQSVNLRPLLAPLIQKNATPEQVEKAAQAIEARIARDPAARAELARITKTIVDSGKVENYGTESAQELLQKWAEQLNTASKPKR